MSETIFTVAPTVDEFVVQLQHQACVLELILLVQRQHRSLAGQGRVSVRAKLPRSTHQMSAAEDWMTKLMAQRCRCLCAAACCHACVSISQHPSTPPQSHFLGAGVVWEGTAAAKRVADGMLARTLVKNALLQATDLGKPSRRKVSAHVQGCESSYVALKAATSRRASWRLSPSSLAGKRELNREGRACGRLL